MNNYNCPRRDSYISFSRLIINILHVSHCIIDTILFPNFIGGIVEFKESAESGYWDGLWDTMNLYLLTKIFLLDSNNLSSLFENKQKFF